MLSVRATLSESGTSLIVGRALLVALCVLVTGPAIVGAVDGTSRSMTIGLLLPQDSLEAASLRSGALRAAAESSPDLGGPVELVTRARTGQWGNEGNEAAALVLDEGVAALIAPRAGTAAHEILQVSGRTRVPVVLLCPDSSVTKAGIPWAVRVVPRTEDEAYALLNAMKPTSSSDEGRYLAFVPPERAGREAARDLQATAQRAGQPLTVTQLSLRSSEWGRQVREGLRLKPTAIFLWMGSNAAGVLVRELRAAGFHGRLAGPSWLRSEPFLFAAGGAAEGLLITEIFSAGDDEHLRSSTLDPLAEAAYDAVLLLRHALVRQSAQRPDLVFRDLAPISGISGRLQFDREGNRRVRLRVIELHGNTFRQRPQSPAEAQNAVADQTP